MLDEPTDLHYQQGAELLHILQQHMAFERKSFADDGSVKVHLGNWRYPRELVAAKGMVDPSLKCRIVPNTQERWTVEFMYPNVEGITQDAFDRCVEETTKNITALGKHMDDIFMLVDGESGTIRAMSEATMSWNGKGTSTTVTLTSVHAVDPYNPYKKADPTDGVQETAS